MTKKIKPAILFLIQLLLLQGVTGQTPLNMTDYLKGKFIRYIKSVPREEVYIHSDRDEYISGEDLWFNIYLIDRQSFKPDTNSKIAYFELLNPENRPIVQKKIKLDGGFGPGQIVLPDTLSTGIYTIRAYTSWMKNFLPDNCFLKEINIYNAFSSKTIKRKINSGKILKDVTSNQADPGVRNTGIVLKVDNLKRDVLEIVINADEKYRSENNNLFYLFIQTHGIIDYVSSERFSDENTKILIPKKQLSAGINHITIFDSNGRPAAERFFYTPAKEILKMTLHLADSLTRRNKTTVDLEIGDLLATTPKSADLSISVSPETNRHLSIDMNDYLVFGTEYGFSPPDVIKNKKVNEIPPEEMDSLLQTVKSNWINWESILKDEFPVFKYQVENEDHYLIGNLSTGKNKEADSDKFVLLSTPGKVAVFQYAKTDKEGNFSFRIHIGEGINNLIIQPDGFTKNQSVNIESSFSDQYPKSDFQVDSTDEKLPAYISAWGVNNQVRKIYGISSIGVPLTRHFSRLRIKRFYGKPDTELIMKDYITLPVMQEVFFELLVGVFLKNKKAGYEIIVNDPINNRPYDNPPGLFVDGVMVKDPGIIAGFDPEIVEKIEVVKEKYFVGDYLFYGIINIITKAGDFSNATLPDDAIRLPYRVVDPVSSFISPDYSSAEKKKSRIPDFRNTLYWNPSVKPDKEGKARIEFWTSDFVSDYEINIQGIAADGKVYSLRKIIKVKSK
jgi:hypothetical protein